MFIKIRVRPNSDKEELKKVSDKEYEIDVKEPAENNKANFRVMNLIAKEFGVSYKNIKIINPRSKDKLIEIKEVNKKR